MPLPTGPRHFAPNHNEAEPPMYAVNGNGAAGMIRAGSNGTRPPVAADGLWAITSYFNPVGYKRRLANYRAFRERLNAPLVAVELAHRDDFDLCEGDADILIQLRGDDVMWQKERLLNVALQALPGTCHTVAWLDCDIIFENKDWAAQALDALASSPVVQLFRHVHYMPRDLPPRGPCKEAAEFTRISLGSGAAAGADIRTCLDEALSRTYGRYANGMAWAARRELLEGIGIYDACILGSGDRAMTAAWFGYFEHAIRHNAMHSPEIDFYTSWAEQMRDRVRGEVRAIEGDLFHLWHGSIENRSYVGRYCGLDRYQFDPAKDIATTEGGLWRWSSEKGEMHRYVRDYFASRREDG
jgi:hypothetical protein